MLHLRSPRAKIVVMVTAIVAFVAALVVEPVSPTTTTSSSSSSSTSSSKRQRQRQRRVEEGGEDEYSVYDRGYLRATSCASYTISLDEEQSYQQQTTNTPGISVVGQETFVFFEYTLYNNTISNDDDNDNENAMNDDKDTTVYDDTVNDDTANNDAMYDDAAADEETVDDDNTSNNDDAYYYNRRNLQDNGQNQNDQQNRYYNYKSDGSYVSYYYYYGSNTILAKDWMVAFSNGSLDSGCIEMEDDMDVFRDAVPGIAEGGLSFSTLYYGPICASDPSGDSNGAPAAPLFEIGLFLDSSCNAYVPGLSQVLHRMILSDWKTGISFRGSNGNNKNGAQNRYSYGRYYGTHGDLQNLDSYETITTQLNDYHNRADGSTTNCQDNPQICQDVTEASVDLNTCQSLASELREAGTDGYEYNCKYKYNCNYDNNSNSDYDDDNDNDASSEEDDQAIERAASDYGEFFYTVTESNITNATTNFTNYEEDEEGTTASSSSSSSTLSHEYHYYRMFQTTLEEYSYCADSTNQNVETNGCSTLGWNYGWGYYDCNTAGNDDDDDEHDGYSYSNSYNGENCQEGVCTAVLESSAKGELLGSFLETNTADLEYEMEHVYGIANITTTTSTTMHSDILVAVYGIVIVMMLVATACWTEGILRSFSKVRRSKIRSFSKGRRSKTRTTTTSTTMSQFNNKEEPFLDYKTTKDGSSSLDGSPANNNTANSRTLAVPLEFAPTSSSSPSLSTLPQSPLPPLPLLDETETAEAIANVIEGYNRGTGHSWTGLADPDRRALS